MNSNLLLSLLMISNFLVAGTHRLGKLIQISAVQGWVLALLIVTVPREHPWHVFLLAGLTAAVKGIVIPRLLLRALKEATQTREMEPYLGPVASLLICAAGTVFSLLVSRMMPLPAGGAASLIAPAALASVLNGFLLLVSRRKALSQVIGYLGLENGIFIFGLLVVEDSPLLLESAMALDLVVGIFVMGIVIHHIQREFSSMDTSRLSELKE